MQPGKAQVRGDDVAAVVILNECLDGDTRRKRVGGAKLADVDGEIAARQLEIVVAPSEFGGKLFADPVLHFWFEGDAVVAESSANPGLKFEAQGSGFVRAGD